MKKVLEVTYKSGSVRRWIALDFRVDHDFYYIETGSDARGTFRQQTSYQ